MKCDECSGNDAVPVTHIPLPNSNAFVELVEIEQLCRECFKQRCATYRDLLDAKRVEAVK